MSGPTPGKPGKGRGRRSIEKEELVGQFVELFHNATWYPALVSGFYRKDNLHQLTLREYPSEFEESKIMGEFRTPSTFELESGGEVKWRRAARQLVTSKDVRKYLNFPVEEKKSDSDLWGKALKVDWGPDGLFVGMIVGCKKVTLSGEDGTKRIRFVWKIMYADEDFESGTFTNKRTCLRLDDDGVKRPVLWFEGDHRPSASQKQFSTPVAQQHTTASIDPKAKPITALAPSRSGQVAGEFGGNSKEHGERLSSVHSVHSAHDIKSGSPEGRITHSNEGIALSRKYGIVRHEQKGLKRTSMGDEKPAIDGSAHSEARGKARSVVNGDADSSEPCGPDDGSLPLKKRASVRARETVGEEPMPHPRGAETSSKGQDPSVPDDAGNNSSDKPSNHNHQQQHPKKKARYKNLNEISGAGEKSQRTLDGKKWTVGGPSRLHHNAEDFIDRSGPVGRGRGQNRGSGRRGGQRGRGPYRAVRKSKPADKEVESENPESLSEPENVSGPLVHEIVDAKKPAAMSSPLSSKSKYESSQKSFQEQKEGSTEGISTKISAEQNQQKVQCANQEGISTAIQKQDDSMKEAQPPHRLSHGKASNGNGGSINATEKVLPMQRRESNASSTDRASAIATPKAPNTGGLVRLKSSAATANPPTHAKPLGKSMSEVRHPARAPSLQSSTSNAGHRKRTVEDFKASLMRSDSKSESGIHAASKTVVGGMSDSDISRQLAINEFEQGMDALNALSRPSKEKIAMCTASAMEGARHGAARKIVQTMVEAMEKERRGDRRVNILYLIDSILRKCDGNEAASKDYPTLISAALNGIIELLSGDIEAFLKLKRVIKIWDDEGKLPEKVMKMAKEKMELVKTRFGDEIDLLDMRYKGVHIIHVPYEGPKCVPAALTNMYGSLGKDDQIKAQLGLGNIKMKFGAHRRNWDDLDQALTKLANAAKLKTKQSDNMVMGTPHYHNTPTQGKLMRNQAPGQFHVHRSEPGRYPTLENRYIANQEIKPSNFMHGPPIVPPPKQASPDPFEQFETVQVEIPPGFAQHGGVGHMRIPPPGFGRTNTDTELKQWMEINNEREFNQAINSSSSTQMDVRQHHGRPDGLAHGQIYTPGDRRPMLYHQGMVHDQASDDMDMDNDSSMPQITPNPPPPHDDAESALPPLPPCPHPDDVWPPLPKSPVEDFPEEAPLPPEPYPGSPPFQPVCSASQPFAEGDKAIAWERGETGYEEPEILPPPVPTMHHYDHQHAQYTANHRSNMRGGGRMYNSHGNYRNVPHNSALPPGYESFQMGGPIRPRGRHLGGNHPRSRPYSRGRFARNDKSQGYPYPGR